MRLSAVAQSPRRGHDAAVSVIAEWESAVRDGVHLVLHRITIAEAARPAVAVPAEPIADAPVDDASHALRKKQLRYRQTAEAYDVELAAVEAERDRLATLPAELW